MPWGATGLIRRLTAFRLHSRHTHRQEVRRFMELTTRTSREGYLARLKALTQYDIRDRLHDLRIPTLFLAAEHDHLVPAVAQARYMASRVPGSVVRVLQGHGHICAIAPDVDFEQILNEWRGALRSLPFRISRRSRIQRVHLLRRSERNTVVAKGNFRSTHFVARKPNPRGSNHGGCDVSWACREIFLTRRKIPHESDHSER